MNVKKIMLTCILVFMATFSCAMTDYEKRQASLLKLQAAYAMNNKIKGKSCYFTPITTHSSSSAAFTVKPVRKSSLDFSMSESIYNMPFEGFDLEKESDRQLLEDCIGAFVLIKNQSDK